MNRTEIQQWYFAKAGITVDKEYNDAKLSHADVVEWLVELSHLLQQADCSKLLELLAQMSKEENEALGKAGFYNLYKREMHSNQKYCLAIVMQMIKERQPID